MKGLREGVLGGVRKASLPSHLVLRRSALVLGISLAFAAVATTVLLSRNLNAMPVPIAQAAGAATSHTYVVNSTLDEPEGDPTTGICASIPSTKCTLRAAIMLSNFTTGPNTITVPSGLYVLTRPGYDDSALVGDLDIMHDLTIQGAGSGATIVDGNGAVTSDRVFQVLDTAQNVTLRGITIRNGQSVSSTVGTIGGGGLFMRGAENLHLSDVTVENNVADMGGGLMILFNTPGGSLDLDHVVLRANTANGSNGGAAGGLFTDVRDGHNQVILRDSQVYSNTAAGDGGGLFILGFLPIPWSIQRTQFYANIAASGGAIKSENPLDISDSLLHDNHASGYGGAIDTASPLTITRSTLDANTAGQSGGSIYERQTYGYPGYTYFSYINGSTLSRNWAQLGGAIYHDGIFISSMRLTLVNSTLSNNVVYGNGGGIYSRSGQVQLLNSTVASNRVLLTFPNHIGLRIGGGLYLTATAILSAENSLIADNLRGNPVIPYVPDDCFSSGTTGSLSFNLFLTITNCYVTGGQIGNIVGQDPLLGPLQNNGGSTSTQALLPGSPAIDAAAPLGCVDPTGATLLTDQRGFHRPAGTHCDIGAVEYYPSAVYLPAIIR